MTKYFAVLFLSSSLISCGCQPKIRKSNTEVKSVSTQTDSIKPPTSTNNTTLKSDTVDKLISMTISPSVFKRPDFNKAKVTLINRTSNNLTAGDYYLIEYYNGTTWEKITFKDVGYNDMAYGLDAHSKREMDVYLKPVPHNYNPGKYRVSKYLRPKNGKDITVIADFMIE
jgi:hypothetical protein